MKKLLILILVVLGLSSCSNSEDTPAEIKYLNPLGEEEVLVITKTEDENEVIEIFENLKQIKPNKLNFNGAEFKIFSKLNSSLMIAAKEAIAVSVGYEMNLNLKSDLKNFLFEGNLALAGFTNTDSNSLALNENYQIDSDIFNDESFWYFDLEFNVGNSKGESKLKYPNPQVQSDISQYIKSSITLLDYYNLIQILNITDEMISIYHVTITSTTKNTFTIKLIIPLTESISIEAYMGFDCEKLLPIYAEINASEMIAEALKKQYIDDYLTTDVTVEAAEFLIRLDIEYGNYTITSKSEEDKQAFREI